MVTNVTQLNNESTTPAIAFNVENVGNSFFIKKGPQTTIVTNGLYISYHQDKPLIMRTKKGFFSLWDNQNYKIVGQWLGQKDSTVLVDGTAQGAGGHVALWIDREGDISLRKV